MKKYINLQNRNLVKMENILGDAVNITERGDIDEDEVLNSVRFEIIEMEDVPGDTLNKMSHNNND